MRVRMIRDVPRIVARALAIALVLALLGMLPPGGVVPQPIAPDRALAAAGECSATGTNYGGASLTISSSTTMGRQHYNIGTFTLNGSVTLTVAGPGEACSVSGTGDGTLTIGATSIVISGTINGDGKGAAGGAGGQGALSTSGTAGTGGCLSTIETCPSGNGGGGGGPSNGNSGSGGGGGGYVAGGAGGAGEANTAGTAGGAYGATTNTLLQKGSGGGGGGAKQGDSNDTGGAGGAGGASIRLLAARDSGAVTIASGGIVSANGATGANGVSTGTSAGGGGGGSGGGIYLRGDTITNSGTVRVNGGNGGNGAKDKAGGGGGGGGGRIKFHSAVAPTDGTRSAIAGSGGTGIGTGANGSAGTAGTTTNTTASPPTSVTLSSLGARFDAAGQAVLRWSTHVEFNTSGFNVLRSASLQGPYERVNQALVPAQLPGGIDGAGYVYADTTAQPGQLYFYKVQEVDLLGRPADDYGPFVAAPPGADLGPLGQVEPQVVPAEGAVPFAPPPRAAPPDEEGSSRTALWIAMGAAGAALALAVMWRWARRQSA